MFLKRETRPKQFKTPPSVLVNLNPNYHFAELPRMPETQLVMTLPRRVWERLGEYIPAYEAVQLAGRFGADPGDYEWEWLSNPEGIRWWRRNITGEESLCGLAVAVRRGDIVELYGLVEIDENSPFWTEAIPEEAANAMPRQADLLARNEGRSEEEALAELYRDYYRSRGMLTMQQPGMPVCRKGSAREVDRFADAIKALVERALRSDLPSELKKP